jgi:hypothetical protein
MTTLVRAWKTKLKNGMFEDNESNIITGPNAPKIGFHYLLHEVIEDPKSLENGNPPWSFPLSTDTFQVGRYKRPKFQLTTDGKGDIIKSTVVGGFNCWYLEFNEKEVRKILAMERDPTFATIVVGSDNVPRTVLNQEEWLTGEPDDLMMANIGDQFSKSYLTKEQGGLNRYLKDKSKKLAEGQTHNSTESTIPTTKRRQYTKLEDNAAS